MIKIRQAIKFSKNTDRQGIRGEATASGPRSMLHLMVNPFSYVLGALGLGLGLGLGALGLMAGPHCYIMSPS